MKHQPLFKKNSLPGRPRGMSVATYLRVVVATRADLIEAADREDMARTLPGRRRDAHEASERVQAADKSRPTANRERKIRRKLRALDPAFVEECVRDYATPGPSVGRGSVGLSPRLAKPISGAPLLRGPRLQRMTWRALAARNMPAPPVIGAQLDAETGLAVEVQS